MSLCDYPEQHAPRMDEREVAMLWKLRGYAIARGDALSETVLYVGL